MSKQNTKLYLQDIIDCIAKINQYVKSLNLNKFIKDPKTLDAVIRNFIIIGEAGNNIPEEIKEKYPKVLWHKIIGLRNKATHEYFNVDETVIWETIKNDLPKLKKQISDLLKEL